MGQDTLDANRTQYYNAPSKGTRNPNIGIYDPDYALTPALSAYTRTGAALYCNRQDYVFTFKVENLFDKIYYDSAGFQGGRNLLAGLPRMFTLSARAYIQ